LTQFSINHAYPIAYFAQIKRAPGMKKKTLRMIKLAYMHKAIEVVLKPLADIAMIGQAS